MLIAFYALKTKGYVPIFTTCYAVFMSFVCKTLTDLSFINCLEESLLDLILLNLILKGSFPRNLIIQLFMRKMFVCF